MQVNDKNKNRGTHGVSSFMLDTLVSSSENPPSFSRGECQESIYILKNMAYLDVERDHEKTEEAIKTAIFALEKQSKKKPKMIDRRPCCPTCGDSWNCNEFGSGMECCWTCGQAIDWEGVEYD